MAFPYENIYLGNFILTLGYLAAQAGIPINRTSLQLLQQTPEDTTVGDLFAGWNGRNFIFEFKRTEQQVKTEFRKRRRVALLEVFESKPEAVALRDISTRCHLVCFPVMSDVTTLTFMPYPFIKNSSSQDRTHSVELSEFCSRLLRQSPDLGAPYREISAYLEILSRLDDDEEDGDSSGGGGPSVIMNISDEGMISLVQVENLHVLAKVLDHQPAIPELSKQKSRGMEL